MNIATIRDYFEKENGDRAWFRIGGVDDSSCDEGYVYGDYATDMCWTTFFSGWQESRKQMVIELPPSLADDLTLIEAIQLTGAKVK